MMNLNYFCPKDELSSMTASVSRGSGQHGWQFLMCRTSLLGFHPVNFLTTVLLALKSTDDSIFPQNPEPLLQEEQASGRGFIQLTNRTKICSEQQQKELLWSVWTQEGQRDSVSRGVLKRDTGRGAEQVSRMFLNQEPALNDWTLSRSKTLIVKGCFHWHLLIYFSMARPHKYTCMLLILVVIGINGTSIVYCDVKICICLEWHPKTQWDHQSHKAWLSKSRWSAHKGERWHLVGVETFSREIMCEEQKASLAILSPWQQKGRWLSPRAGDLNVLMLSFMLAIKCDCQKSWCRSASLNLPPLIVDAAFHWVVFRNCNFNEGNCATLLIYMSCWRKGVIWCCTKRAG